MIATQGAAGVQVAAAEAGGEPAEGSPGGAALVESHPPGVRRLVMGYLGLWCVLTAAFGLPCIIYALVVNEWVAGAVAVLMFAAVFGW